MGQINQSARQVSNGSRGIRFLTESKYRRLRHLIGVLPGLLLLGAKILDPKDGEFERTFDIINVTMAVMGLYLILYINMYVLIPKFFYRRQLMYVVTLAIICAVVLLGIDGVQELVLNDHRLKPPASADGKLKRIAVATIFLMPLFLFTTGIKLFQRWVQENARAQAFETKYLESELRSLRNQINPHFLFNMLNNLNATIVKNPEAASKIVIQLANFLRYHLQETNEQDAFLASEIKFIRDFVELEKIRRDDFQFDLKVDASLSGIKVPVKIFVNIVENAVKFSADPHNPSYIKIDFSTIDEVLVLRCINSKPARHRQEVEGYGLGIQNTIRRLDILYGTRYTLEIKDEPTKFELILNLPI